MLLVALPHEVQVGTAAEGLDVLHVGPGYLHGSHATSDTQEVHGVQAAALLGAPVYVIGHYGHILTAQGILFVGPSGLYLGGVDVVGHVGVYPL